MAVIWGGFVGTGNNRFRMGIEYTAVGKPTSQAQTHVSVSASIWINTVAAVRDASTKLDWSGTLGNGSTTAYINTSAYGTQKLYSFTEPVALNAASPTTVTMAAALSGIDAFGAGLRAVATVSTTIPAKPTDPGSPPTTPSSLTATRLSDYQTRLTPGSSMGGATRLRYEVYDYAKGGSYKFAANTSSTAAFYWNAGSVNNRFSWRVRGENAAGVSGWRYNTTDVYTSPAAPTNVTAKRVGADIIVSWKDGAPYNTQFRVRDNPGGAGWGTPVVVTSAGASWTDTAPEESVNHRYQVSLGVNGVWGPWSESSNTVELSQKPGPPTPVRPVGTTVDIYDATTTFEWKHNPKDSSEQTQAEVRYFYYTTPGATTVVPVSGSSQTVTAPTVLIPGEYVWQVRTRGVNVAWSDWSPQASFFVGNPPEVSISGPSGTINSSRLTIAWDYADVEGDEQVNALVELLDGASGAVLWSGNVTGSGTSSDVGISVPQGTYRSRVTAMDSTGLTGTDTSPLFTVEFIPPEPPLLEVEWDRETLSAVLKTTPVDGLQTTRWNLFTNPSLETTPTQWSVRPNDPNTQGAAVSGSLAWVGQNAFRSVPTTFGFRELGVRVRLASSAAVNVASGATVSFSIMVGLPAGKNLAGALLLRYGQHAAGMFTQVLMDPAEPLGAGPGGLWWYRLKKENLTLVQQADAFEVVIDGAWASGEFAVFDAAFLTPGTSLGGSYFDSFNGGNGSLRYGTNDAGQTWEATPLPPGETGDIVVEPTNSIRLERSLDGDNWVPVGRDLQPLSESRDPIPPLNQMVWFRAWSVSDEGAEAVGDAVSIYTESLEGVINYGPGLENTLIFTCQMSLPSSLESYAVTHVLSGRALPVNVYDLDHEAPVTVSVTATKLHTHVPDLEAVFKLLLRQDVYWRDYQRRAMGGRVDSPSITPLFIHRNSREDENHPVASFQVIESDAIFNGDFNG